MPQPNAKQTGTEGRGRNFGLDMVRATAILLVMVSHWANNFSVWLGTQVDSRVFFAGELGVDLFFALSGFLIGRILLEIAQTAPTPTNYAIFMVRRWMRTLPLYLLCVAVLFIFFPPMEDSGALLLQFLTLSQNLLHPMPPRWYFSVSWSLAIEEWFYLLFGLTLIGMTILLQRWRIALSVSLMAFMATPLALRFGVSDYARWDSTLHQMVFFRIDAIAYGVMLAYLCMQGSLLFRRPLLPLCTGLLLILWAWSGRLPLSSGLTAILIHNILILGCVLCLPAAIKLHHVSGAAATMVRMISAQSYALYLIHATVMLEVQNQLWGPGRLGAFPCICISVTLPFVLSFLTLHLFEQPILSHRPAQRLALARGDGRPISASAPRSNAHRIST